MALLHEIRQLLDSAGIASPEIEARRIVETALGQAAVPATSTVRVTVAAREMVLAMAQRRARGEPLQYITGTAGFRFIELRVGPGVFIPRPETELVAESAMSLLEPGATLVDVGTGSGAIAIAIAYERPDATVVATERSPAAMAWAERNRELLDLDVELLRGDLLAPLPDRLRGTIAVVVSNPPYVGAAEGPDLPADVVDHEPHEALFAGRDGLATVTRLVLEARGWLRPHGHLVLEIGETQGDAVAGLLEASGYREVKVTADLTGRPRIAQGRWPG